MNVDLKIRFDDNKDSFGTYYRFRGDKYFKESIRRVFEKLRKIKQSNLNLSAKKYK